MVVFVTHAMVVNTTEGIGCFRAIARMLGTTEKAGLFDATIQQQFNPATARMGALQREERDALGTKAVHMSSAEQGRYPIP